MAFTQSNRQLQINPPLGPDELLILKMEGREELGRLFEYTIDLLSDQVGHEVLQGKWNARGITTGGLFKMIEHPRGDQNREYLITGVYYSLYSDAFESAVPEIAEGPQTASDEYLQNELNLFQSCDNVITAIRVKQHHQCNLKQFDEFFRNLTEEALLPYYQRLCVAKVE